MACRPLSASCKPPSGARLSSAARFVVSCSPRAAPSKPEVLLQMQSGDMMRGVCCCAVALLLVVPLPSLEAFLTTSTLSAKAATSRQRQRTTCVNRLFMSESHDPVAAAAAKSTPPSQGSRGEFLRRGALTAAWGLAAVSGAPSASQAKDFGGIDVRGIDVAEVLHPGAGGGGKASKPLRDCLLNVERVRVSTKQLEDTLTNEDTPPGLTGLVKGLIKNYRLDESLQQGALYIESQRDRNAAASAGMEAMEYLAQTAEYYPVVIDDRTGAPKKMSAEALEFTVNALGATREKLDIFLSKVPRDALLEARAEVKAEGEPGGT